jgi:nucleotide-binding universal stress UspA family protein
VWERRDVKAAKGAARRTSSDRRRRVPAVKKDDRARGISSFKLLLVIDTTEASKRVLRYVGRLAAGHDGPELHLAYIATHVPPELLEFGGSERPECEERLESNLRRQQRGWMAVADRKDWRVLGAAEATLQRAGVAAPHIFAYVSSPLDARTAADEVLVLARDHRCGTVVVGHRAHSWLRGLGGGDLADQLVRRAKGYAVWVIG